MPNFCGDDTIAAISTPSGSGGIGIIRLSGRDACAVADKIFIHSRNDIRECREVSRMSSYTMKHGYIVDIETRELVDEVIVSLMKGPKSYTGEDVVEVNSHGGFAVVRKILSIIYKAGARPAEPGEFTKRAFLNGRIGLSEAEAVSDIIKAQTESSRKAAMNQLAGALTNELDSVSQALSDTLARIEVAIDYPEYDEDETICGEAIASLSPAKEKLCHLVSTYKNGRLLKEGVRIAIVGRPNAGKSSLLNALLGISRAIVTDIPGTTRDTIEETMEIDGFPIVLTDTAGIRKTDDIVEQIGVERAYSELSNADLVFYLIDGTSEIAEDEQILRQIKEKLTSNQKLSIFVNKKDAIDDAQMKYFTNEGANYVLTSVKDDGANDFIAEIRKFLSNYDSNLGGAVVTAERHKLLLDKALEAISRAIHSAETKQPLDFISIDVWECANKIGEITGKNVTDDVIDSIFSKFCLGK